MVKRIIAFIISLMAFNLYAECFAGREANAGRPYWEPYWLKKELRDNYSAALDQYGHILGLDLHDLRYKTPLRSRLRNFFIDNTFGKHSDCRRIYVAPHAVVRGKVTFISRNSEICDAGFFVYREKVRIKNLECR